MSKAVTIQDGTPFLEVMSSKDFFNVANAQGHVDQLYRSPQADTFFTSQYEKLAVSYSQYKSKVPSTVAVQNGNVRITRNDGLPLDAAQRRVQDNLNAIVRIVSFTTGTDMPTVAANTVNDFNTR